MNNAWVAMKRDGSKLEQLIRGNGDAERLLDLFKQAGEVTDRNHIMRNVSSAALHLALIRNVVSSLRKSPAI